MKGATHLLPGHMIHGSVATAVRGEEHCRKLKWFVGLVWFYLIYVSCQALVVKLVLVVFVLSSSSIVDCFILPTVDNKEDGDSGSNQ